MTYQTMTYPLWRRCVCWLANLVLPVHQVELAWIEYPRCRFILLYHDTDTGWIVRPPKPRKIWVLPI